MHGYNAAYLLVEVLKRIQGEPTGEKIAAEMERIKGLDTGLMSPLTFTAEQHAGSQSAAFMRAKDGKWSIVTDWIKGN
jgi:hypothetical protein